MGKSLTVALISTVIDLLIAVVKGVLAFTTGSVALLAETLHTLGDTLAGLGIWYSLRQERYRKEMVMETQEALQAREKRWGLEARRVERVWSADKFRFYKEHVEKKLAVFIAVAMLAMGAYSGWSAWRAISEASRPEVTTSLPVLVLIALGLVSYFVSRFIQQVATLEKQEDMARGSGRAKADALGSVLVAAVLACRYWNITDFDGLAGGVISLIMVLQGLEILLSTGRSSFEDRRLADLETDPHDVYRRPMVLARLLSGSGWLSLLGFLHAGLAVQTGQRRPLKFLQQHLPGIVGISAALFLLQSMFFVVQPNERVILERLGRAVNLDNPAGAGLHVKWPWPIDRAVRIPTTKVRQISFGLREERDEPFVMWDRPHYEEEYSFVTAGQVFTVATLYVWYDVSSPADYYTSSIRPGDVIEQEGYGVLTAVAGRNPISALMAEKREQIEQDIQRRLQKRLDEHAIGLRILSVGLTDVHPPVEQEVAQAYLKVINSLELKEKEINLAHAEADSVVRDAEAAAVEDVTRAGADATRTVMEAKGRANKFERIVGAYKESPDVTRLRLYFEQIKEILSDTGKVILDPKATTGPIEVWLQGGRKPIPFLETLAEMPTDEDKKH